MKKLIKFEFSKLFKMKTFYLFMGIAGILLLMNVLVLFAVDLLAGGYSGYLSSSNSIGSLVLTSVNLSNFLLVYSIFVVILVCADFSSGSIKNIFARGYSRIEVYVAKYLSGLFSLIVNLCFLFLFALLLGVIFYSKSLVVIDNYFLTFVSLVFATIACYSISFLIAYTFSKFAPGLIFNIVIAFVIPLISSLIMILFDDSIPSHLVFFPHAFVSTPHSLSIGEALLSIFMSLIYVGISFGLGFVLNRKKEV